MPLVCECFELGLSDLPLKSGHPGVTADSQAVMSPQVHQGHLQPLLSVEMVVNPHCHRRYGRDYDCPTGDGMNVAVCPAGIRTEVSAAPKFPHVSKRAATAAVIVDFTNVVMCQK